MEYVGKEELHEVKCLLMNHLTFHICIILKVKHLLWVFEEKRDFNGKKWVLHDVFTFPR